MSITNDFMIKSEEKREKWQPQAGDTCVAYESASKYNVVILRDLKDGVYEVESLWSSDKFRVHRNQLRRLVKRKKVRRTFWIKERKEGLCPYCLNHSDTVMNEPYPGKEWIKVKECKK